MRRCIGVVVISTAVLMSCADNASSDRDRGDHVWKAQTDALDKARLVEEVVHDAAQKRRESIERHQ